MQTLHWVEKQKHQVMQVYGASFMTAARDVFLLSGIRGSCRRTPMNNIPVVPFGDIYKVMGALLAFDMDLKAV